MRGGREDAFSKGGRNDFSTYVADPIIEFVRVYSAPENQEKLKQFIDVTFSIPADGSQLIEFPGKKVLICWIENYIKLSPPDQDLFKGVLLNFLEKVTEIEDKFKGPAFDLVKKFLAFAKALLVVLRSPEDPQIILDNIRGGNIIDEILSRLVKLEVWFKLTGEEIAILKSILTQ